MQKKRPGQVSKISKKNNILHETDEASLTLPPLTSCCVAQFLTGHGPLNPRSPGVGDPCSNLWNEPALSLQDPILS
uniref:Uncharacterized protein n=1 Tax=Balaenoptera musculus TaxID=9771 RepID=A0A8C0I6F9_BALMU